MPKGASKVKAKLRILWGSFGMFLRSKRKMALVTPLTLILGGILAESGKWFWDEKIQPKDYYLTVRANDASPPFAPLPNVTVGLELKTGYIHATTDKLGKAGITIPHANKGLTVTPEIALDGYHIPQGGTASPIEIRRLSALHTDILLERISDSASKLVTPPNGETEKRDEVPKDSIGLAPKALITQEIYRSPNLPSGAGADLSQLYTLCSPDKPPEWIIVESSFNLDGDRSCGAWAVCQAEAQNSDRKVCWHFQMQGHNEEVGPFRGGNTGIHFSTGVLTVKWRHPTS